MDTLLPHQPLTPCDHETREEMQETFPFDI